MTSGPAPVGPLSDLFVLEFSAIIAGPYGAQLLAMMGADVVRVEPLTGARGRQGGWGPAVNHSRRSVAIDMDARQDISVVKVLATEMLWRVADRAIQVHGGIGVTKDLPLEKIYRDARLDRIVDGPNEVHRWVIARNLLRDGIPGW